ncbi:CHAT domain-containing protein [Russula dissimulans]|nr:CHAT domain-containing protein [Russula dissimulans]
MAASQLYLCEIDKHISDCSPVTLRPASTTFGIVGTAHLEPQMLETALCHELLASDDLEGPPTNAVETLASTLYFEVGLRDEPLERVIICLRDASTRLPNLHDVSNGLAYSLFMRFHVTHSSGDYEEAIAIVDKITASYSSRRHPDTHIYKSLNLAAMIAEARFFYSANPEYLEEAIFRVQTFLSILSPEDPSYLHYNQSLAKLERKRSDEFGVTNGLPEAHSRDPEVIDNNSFSSLAASLAKSNTVKSLPMKRADMIRHLDILIAMLQLTDIADIEEAIKYGRLLLASLCSTDDMAHHTTIMLGDLLFRAFRCTDNAEHLNASIAVLRDSLKMPASQWVPLFIIRLLISCLTSRFLLSNNRKDFDEIMQLFPIAAADKSATVPQRFKISFQWVLFARASIHPSMSTAYDSAISLMQDSLVFAHTLEIQHFRLATMGDDYKKLPLDYAAYQVQIGRLEQAIETLERGRGLLWSEMRGLRTSIDRLRLIDMQLADKISALNLDLEALTMSGPPRVWRNDDQVERGEGMDPFGRLMVEQRKLVEERDRLNLQIRTLPGFERFLMAPSFDTLRLKDQLLAARKEGLSSKAYEDSLKFVLESLYELVGRPVIQVLRKSNVPEQSRVWLCPTSDFCSLPLHAMGPFSSDDGAKKVYFSDLYISSYTPTLSALIESRKPGAQTFSGPSLLLVAQPDASLPGVKGEIRVMQAVETQVTSLISRNATSDTVVEGLRHHQLVHFACHGTLEVGKPFNASFKLHRDERLTLLRIIRSRLPAAEFAFLSACHTAELTEESVADEALHLAAAAMQYCGFRSVVGTMWAMADTDGRDLARHFYRDMLSDSGSDQGKAIVPLYERSAVSLRDAVQTLGKKSGVTLERWVNFVHYGA